MYVCTDLTWVYTLTQKSYGEVESETMFTPREKKNSTGKKFSSGKDQTHDAASSRTKSSTRYQLSYSGPVNGDACTDLQTCV